MCEFMSLLFRNPRYTILTQLFVVVLFVAVLLFCYSVEFKICILCNRIQVEQPSISQMELRIQEISNYNVIYTARKHKTKINFETEDESIVGDVLKCKMDKEGGYIIDIYSRNTLRKLKYNKGYIIIKKSLLEYIVENIYSK